MTSKANATSSFFVSQLEMAARMAGTPLYTVGVKNTRPSSRTASKNFLITSAAKVIVIQRETNDVHLTGASNLNSSEI